MKGCLLCVLFFFLNIVASGFGEKNSDFVFVGFEKASYQNSSLDVQGALFETMKTVCEKENLHCKFKVTSLRTALTMLNQGKAQGGGPFSPSTQRKNSLLLSMPLFLPDNIRLPIEGNIVIGNIETAPGNALPVCLAFSKKGLHHGDYEKIISRLRKMKDNGDLREIADKYKLQLADTAG